MSDRFGQVARIFDEVAVAPSDARAELLDAACGDDEELRAEVESLLRHHVDAATSDHVLAAVQVRASIPTVNDDDSESPIPERIGAYRPVERLGAGGMGIVYRALQEHPERSVALKVIRASLMGGQALRRFEYEADLLARVNHPGIAQVFEAGVDERGDTPVPFIAIEYIEGAVSITDHAKSAQLGTREIVQLFTRVCDAVEHGHRRGIIHRDLKPSNILIAADGQPKVIDFGVARAVDSDVTASMHTVAGQLVGTLGYMSPEAVQANPDEIDTRTDVYGLGAVLFELLTERLPCPIEGLPLPEIARRIVDHHVPSPSSLAPIKGIPPSDLDTIVLKALDKDRDRRYASAGELADELRRVLRGHSIVARRQSRFYVLRRFVSRHRIPMSIGAVTLAILLALTINAAWQYHQRGVLEATSREMLAYTNWELDDPFRHVNVSVEEVDRVRSYAADLLVGHDDLEAMMRLRAGLGYFRLQRWREAEAEFRRVLTLERARAAPPGEAVANALWNLGNTLYFRDQLDVARVQYEECLQIRTRLYGQRHVLVADALTGLAACDRREGDFDAAERRNRDVVAMEIELRPPEDPWIAASLNNLAASLCDRGAFGDARAFFEDAVARIERLGVRPEFRARGMRNIATCWLGVGDWRSADAIAEEAIQFVRAGVGPSSPEIAPSFTLRARCALVAGEPAHAVDMAREALRAHARADRDVSPETTDNEVLDTQMVLARALVEAGRSEDLSEAATLAQQVYERRSVGTSVLDQAESAVALAEVRLARGDAEAAAKLCLAALEAQMPRLLQGHPDLVRTQRILDAANLEPTMTEGPAPARRPAEGTGPDAQTRDSHSGG